MRGKRTKKVSRQPENVGQTATCHRCGKQKTIHPPYELAPDFRWFCSLACRTFGHQQHERPAKVDLSVLAEITPELLSETIARCFPGITVSVEAISEAEAQRRIDEGGGLFRS